ncbi:MAG: ABC transporter substrate-binding protein [Planctomycetota bacterium]|nr:ABC transporter substrate-binding protein [Planctomycetota bacterium]
MRNSMWFMTWVASVLAGAAGLGGCKKDTDIPVGVNLPLSDSLSPYGLATLDGIKLRVKQINDAGGINGRRIRLEIQDNQGKDTESRAVFKMLADMKDVVAVLGPITSTCALAAKLDAGQTQTPMITPTATNDMVTANSKYAFRACFLDSFQGREVALYAREKGLSKAAVMVDSGSDYSQGVSASFAKAFEAAGGKIVAQESYQGKDQDFGMQLVRIKNAGAETIFVPAYPPNVQDIIRQAKVVGFTGRLCGSDGWDNNVVIEHSGENIEGCFFMAAYWPGEQRKVVQDFVRDMLAQTGHMPGSFEALGFDAMLLLGEAMKKGLTRQEIADALRGLKDIEGVTGTISITPGGDAVKGAVILQVVKKDGKCATELAKKVPIRK